MLYDIFSNKADDLRLGEFLPEEFELSFGVDYFFLETAVLLEYGFLDMECRLCFHLPAQ